MPELPAPTHRVRSKSAPRGRSPDSKVLRKAAEKEKHRKKTQNAKNAVFTTPPPKPRIESPGVSGPKALKRRISFSNKDKIHDIEAENPAPEMKQEEADKIFAAMKDHNLGIPGLGEIVNQLGFGIANEIGFEYVLWDN